MSEQLSTHITETKPQHVAVEVGQTWEHLQASFCYAVGECFKVTAIGPPQIINGRPYRVVQWRYIDGHKDSSFDDFFDPETKHARLIAPAPAAIPAAPKVEERATPPKGYEECPLKCGRWYLPCDMFGVFRGCNRCFIAANGDVPGRLATLEKQFGPDWSPPMTAPKAIEAAKPVTAAFPDVHPKGCHCARCRPVAVVPAKPAVCIDCGNGPAVPRYVGRLSSPRPWCEGCFLRYEANINTDGLTNVLDNDKRPALIDRRLSHVANCHDDDLVGP